MNTEQAKAILLWYRPGMEAADDPELASALRLCANDPELQRWFENLSATHAALREKFKQTPIPEGLKEQILAERNVNVEPMQRRRWVFAAAAVLLALGLAAVFWPSSETAPDFTTYRRRMVGTALRGYQMDLATNDLAQIRAYCAQQGAAADFVLPRGLATEAQPTGCLVMAWQGRKVTMVCFRSGRVLPPGQSSDLWFFVSDPQGTADAPLNDTLSVAKWERVATAQWRAGNKTYLLVADGNAEWLRRFL